MPTGARDEYIYTVSGKESITKIVPVDKPLPTPPNNPYNPNANNDNGNNGQAENGSNDNNSRENQTRLDNANNSSDLANNNSGEVPLPQDTKSPYDVFARHGWNWSDFLTGVKKEFAAGARDAQSTGLQYEFPADVAKDISGGFDPYIDADPYAPTNSAQEWGGYLAIGGSLVYGGKNPASAGNKIVNKADDLAETAAKKAEQLAKNKAKGSQFEKSVGNEYAQDGAKLTPQVTLKTDNGIKTRPDFVGVDKNGKPLCVECKSSSTAPLTKNQEKAFPEIEKNGATVVGKGTPEFPAGTRFPPTKPTVVRPNSN